MMPFLKRPFFVWVFVGLVILGIWKNGAVWASPDQSPAGQTVPTRVRTPPSPPPVTEPTTAPTAGQARSTTVPTLTLAALSTSTVAPSLQAEIFATAKENLQILAAPATLASVVGQLKKGDRAQIIGRTVASDWWQILLSTNPNERGWISAGLTDVSDGTDGIPIIGVTTLTNTPIPPTSTPSPSATPVFPTSTLTPTVIAVANTPLASDDSVSNETSLATGGVSSPSLTVIGLTGIVWLGTTLGLVLLVVGFIVRFVESRRA